MLYNFSWPSSWPFIATYKLCVVIRVICGTGAEEVPDLGHFTTPCVPLESENWLWEPNYIESVNTH